eukprot:905658-Rhodomonas_salina.1
MMCLVRIAGTAWIQSAMNMSAWRSRAARLLTPLVTPMTVRFVQLADATDDSHSPSVRYTCSEHKRA